MSNHIFLAAKAEYAFGEALIVTLVCILPIIPVFLVLQKLVKKKLKKLHAALLALVIGAAMVWLEMIILSMLNINYVSELFYSNAAVFVFSIYEALSDGSLLVRKLKKSEKFCPRCKRVLPKEAAFCSECGFSFANPDGFLCLNCGAYLPSHAAFCDKCGTKIK